MKHEGKLEGREFSPRPRRNEVGYDVVVRFEAGEFGARLLNLSGMGFRLQTERQVEVGWQVSLEMAKLPPVKAVIRWTCGLDCGGAFAEPVAL